MIFKRSWWFGCLLALWLVLSQTAFCASRTTYYAEDTSRTTTTSTSYQDKVTLNWTPDSTDDHWCLWSGVFDQTDGTQDVKVKFLNGSASTDYSIINVEAKDVSDKFTFFGMKRYQPPDTSAKTFKIQYATESATSTVGADDVALVVIKSNSADQYAEADSDSTTTSASYSTKTTLTFTPATTGDYLIIATAEININNASNAYGVRLVHSGTNYGDTTAANDDVNTYRPWGTMVKLNLANSSQTFTIQYNAAGSSTATIRRARILAIRLDTLDNAYYAESRSRATTTSTSFSDKATLTQTPLNKAHVIIGSSLIDGSSTSVSSQTRFLEGATTMLDAIQETNLAANEYPSFYVYQKTLAASSTTWKTQYASEGAANTCGISESAIAILQTEGSATTHSMIATALGTGTGQAAMVRNKNALTGTSTGAGTSQALMGRRMPHAGSMLGQGTLSGASNLYARYAATATGSGLLQGSAQLNKLSLTGTTTGSGLGQGAMSLNKATLTAASSGVGLTNAILGIQRPISGSTSGSGLLSGSFNLFKRMVVTATGSGTDTGALSVVKRYAATSTGNGTAQASFVLNKAGLAATSTGNGTAQASFVLNKAGLAATSTGNGTAQGSARVVRGLAATSTGSGLAQSNVTIYRRFTATASGTGLMNGSIGGLQVITGTSTGSGTLAAPISLRLAFATTATGSGVSQGAITPRRGIAATSSGTGLAQAAASITKRYSGTTSGAGATQASMTLNKVMLAAASTGNGLAQGAMRLNKVTMSGSMAGTGSLSAPLDTTTGGGGTTPRMMNRKNRTF